MLFKIAVVAAGVSGYYFIRKLWNDPFFKHFEDEWAKAALMEEQSNRIVSELLESNDYDSAQKFFKKGIELGDVVIFIESWSIFLAACGEPSDLEALEARLPPPVFGLLKQRMAAHRQPKTAARRLQEEEVECNQSCEYCGNKISSDNNKLIK